MPSFFMLKCKCGPVVAPICWITVRNLYKDY